MMHHLPDDWVLAEGAGTLDAARSVLVATHCTLCGPCRQRVDSATAIASSILGSLAPEPLTTPAPALTPQVESDVPDSPWPMPVAELVGDRTWRWAAPGLWQITLPVPTPDSMPLRLIWMRQGKHLPHHDGGEESAVLLQGGWSDQTGSYGVGDVYHHDTGHEFHDQTIDPGEDCVALVLNAKPTIPTRTWLRWFVKL